MLWKVSAITKYDFTDYLHQIVRSEPKHTSKKTITTTGKLHTVADSHYKNECRVWY